METPNNTKGLMVADVMKYMPEPIQIATQTGFERIQDINNLAQKGEIETAFNQLHEFLCNFFFLFMSSLCEESPVELAIKVKEEEEVVVQ